MLIHIYSLRYFFSKIQQIKYLNSQTLTNSVKPEATVDCGIWSESTLFATHPALFQNIFRHIEK